MKVMILAGGFGTRISEYTQTIPKPMVPIGGDPILVHIMKRYADFGYNDFLIALGYKASVIKQYFLNYNSLSSDFKIDLQSGDLQHVNVSKIDWQVSLFNTGINTMTGGRVLRLREHVGNETFMLTYGDGLSNINFDDLVDFHKSHGKMVTVSAVHPVARFGEIQIKENIVESFKEKPQLTQGWINGGFFVIEPEFFDLIDNDQSILEREPLEKAAQLGELMAYCHEDFWHCMDTVRDKDLLEDMWKKGNPPWMKIHE